ncbi:MAG TPA: excisionase family DNA-binding protein [Fimbriiglobus sp.]|jgi:excisionase family DNA binding protein|nr:excisionase family DNA-binding protein [Fimbriiglobus sp.]
MTTTTPQLQPEQTRAPGSPWSINDAAQFLHVSTRHLHRMLDGNKVRSLRLGRRRLIPDEEVRRLAREGC